MDNKNNIRYSTSMYSNTIKKYQWVQQKVFVVKKKQQNNKNIRFIASVYINATHSWKYSIRFITSMYSTT